MALPTTLAARCFSWAYETRYKGLQQRHGCVRAWKNDMCYVCILAADWSGHLSPEEHTAGEHRWRLLWDNFLAPFPSRTPRAHPIQTEPGGLYAIACTVVEPRLRATVPYMSSSKHC